MKKFKIGIDIDNVIADSYPAFLAKFNQTFGTEIEYEEIFDFYYLEKHTGIEEIHVKEFVDKFVVDEIFQINIPPFAGAKEVIDKWSKKGCLLHYITSRPQNTRDITYRWLRKQGFLVPGSTLDVFESPEHHDVHRPQIIEYKMTKTKLRNIDLMIEDSKEIAESMDIPVLLLDRPWNRGKLSKNVKRVKDWQEIDEFVSEFKPRK